MKPLPPQPTLVDQVYEAILSDISADKFVNDARLRQEEPAESPRVPRQPIRQTLLPLKSQRIPRDAARPLHP